MVQENVSGGVLVAGSWVEPHLAVTGALRDPTRGTLADAVVTAVLVPAHCDSFTPVSCPVAVHDPARSLAGTLLPNHVAGVAFHGGESVMLPAWAIRDLGEVEAPILVLEELRDDMSRRLREFEPERCWWSR